MGLGLAVAVSSAYAQTTNLPGTLTLPGRSSSGVSFNPLILILPAVAVAVFLGERAHATPTSAEADRAPGDPVDSSAGSQSTRHELPAGARVGRERIAAAAR
jgi:hypothetical protein